MYGTAGFFAGCILATFALIGGLLYNYSKSEIKKAVLVDQLFQKTRLQLLLHDFLKPHFIISFQLGFLPYIRIPVR